MLINLLMIVASGYGLMMIAAGAVNLYDRFDRKKKQIENDAQEEQYRKLRKEEVSAMQETARAMGDYVNTLRRAHPSS